MPSLPPSLSSPPPPPPPGDKEWADFEPLIRQSPWPLLFTNLRHLPGEWLGKDGYQHVTGGELDELSPTWFVHFHQWLSGMTSQRRPSIPSPSMSNLIHRLRTLPPGTTTLIAADGAERAELMFHLATLPGQRRLTLILAAESGRIIDWTHHWRQRYCPTGLSCLWVVTGRERERLEYKRPAEMAFIRTSDIPVIRHFLGQRDGHPRVLFATFAAIPLIRQAQWGLGPLESLLIPDTHLLPKSQGPDPLPMARHQLCFTDIPRRTHPTKKDRQDQPELVFSLVDTPSHTPPLHLATLIPSRERLFVRERKLLLVAVPPSLLERPQALLSHVLSVCLREYPGLKYARTTQEGDLGDRVTLPETGDIPIISLTPDTDALTAHERLHTCFRQERAILATPALPAAVKSHALVELTLLPAQPGGESDPWWHEHFTTTGRPNGAYPLGLVALPFAWNATHPDSPPEAPPPPPWPARQNPGGPPGGFPPGVGRGAGGRGRGRARETAGPGP
ncbi:MAG: hypothetical protein HQL76_16710, partial [Magnetococcales bacterium]|nr:hypothetical protein [Magnetococcales bacterium]